MSPTVIASPDLLAGLVGAEVGVSPWLTVTQDMVDTFARVTGDEQWIHVDAERARRESPYQSTIAHGFFTLSLVSRLHGEAVRIEGVERVINYGLNRLRFPAAVKVGSSIRCRSALHSVEPKDDSLQVTWLITIEMSGESKPAAVAEWVVRLYRQ